MKQRQFNLADLFEIVVDTVPHRLALVVAGSSGLTCRQLDERANRFADHLRSTGIRAGERVGILAQNRAGQDQYAAAVVRIDLRTADDLYILYAGGTTGMPKGVIWRHEGIFFAALGGGGWGGPPISDATELADRISIDEPARVVVMAVAPLMHGNAQWAIWNAFFMGGTAVLYDEAHFDPELVLVRRFSTTQGSVAASATVSQIDPVHTP
ncbi:MAG: AMP-binding protein [Streptosporangiaceae bacterium]